MIILKKNQDSVLILLIIILYSSVVNAQTAPLQSKVVVLNQAVEITAGGIQPEDALLNRDAFIFRNSTGDGRPLYLLWSLGESEADMSLTFLKSLATTQTEVEIVYTPVFPLASQVFMDDSAQWLSLKLNAFVGNGVVTITGEHPEQTQILTQQDLNTLNGQTAIFDGSSVVVRVYSAPGDEEGKGYNLSVDSITIGSGVTLDKDSADHAPEAICGDADDRVPHDHRFDGRIMPVGCTGFLVSADTFLTAGHCMGGDMNEIQFNVPMSTDDGKPVGSANINRYMVVPASIVGSDNGVGDDWALFRSLPNGITGQLPGVHRQGHYLLYEKSRSNALTISGYGLDDDPRGPSPVTNFLNKFSQTQQIDTGPLNSMPGANPMTHKIDTRGGNSGSAIRDNRRSNQAFGIHTHGGCRVGTMTNKGTSLSHRPLKEAIKARGIRIFDIQAKSCPTPRPVPKDDSNPGCIVSCNDGKWDICGCSGTPVCM